MGSTLKLLVTFHFVCILILTPLSLTSTSETESSLCAEKVLPKNNYYCPANDSRPADATIELIGILFELGIGEGLMSGALAYSIENVNR